MSITAKYAAVCSSCKGRIAPGQKIEWTKGQPVRHTTCGSAIATAAAKATPGTCRCGKSIDAKYTQCYSCANPGAAKSTRRRGTWTGCSCGSVEEYERDGDCFSCRHDR